MRLATAPRGIVISSVTTILSRQKLQLHQAHSNFSEQKSFGSPFCHQKASRAFHQSLFNSTNNQTVVQSLNPTSSAMAAMKQAVLTDKAPPPAPFLSQGIIVNGMVYCSGQIGQDPKTGKVVEGTIQDRTV
jgi:primosomal protein N''